MKPKPQPRGRSRRGWAGVTACAAVLVCCADAPAVNLSPSEGDVQVALERGKAAANSRILPARLYSWFGPTNELEPHGFLMTRMGGLTVMATHFALRGEVPSQEEVARILEDPWLLVSVVLYGDRPDFAVDSYLVLVQGDRTIKPVKVRFDGRAARSSAWPSQPAYRAKVVASVSYDDLDPRARTRISVFPGSGGEVTFDLDFATID